MNEEEKARGRYQEQWLRLASIYQHIYCWPEKNHQQPMI